MSRYGPPRRPAIDRAFEKIIASNAQGCWEWTGAYQGSGYAVIRNDDHRNVCVHRFIWETHNGPVSPGLELDHLCRNRGCVNPSHVEPVTPSENQRRGYSVAGINAAKTHCVRGHPFDEANTYRYPNKLSRGCRACRAAWDLYYKAQKRGMACR